MRIAGALWLAGCASNPPASVEERSFGDSGASAGSTVRKIPTQTLAIGGTYRVVRGDTLYAIAFKHGVDYRDLAAWNRIVPPYRIYAGQELRLSVPATSTGAAAPVAGTATAATAPERSVAAPASMRSVMAQNPHVDNDTLSPPVPTASVGAPPVREATPPATAPVAAPAAPTPAPAAVPQKPAAVPLVVGQAPAKPDESAAQLNAGGVTWRWPGNGKVVGTYVSGDQTRQGIDIAGKAGDSVQAAADGEVVYSGNGLLGYGELIIVKHNASFLSAYGYNRKRLVQEGDKIHAGQQIAEMGLSAGAREELHFEIRKNGKPVNPLDYLPVR